MASAVATFIDRQCWLFSDNYKEEISKQAWDLSLPGMVIFQPAKIAVTWSSTLTWTGAALSHQKQWHTAVSMSYLFPPTAERWNLFIQNQACHTSLLVQITYWCPKLQEFRTKARTSKGKINDGHLKSLPTSQDSATSSKLMLQFSNKDKNECLCSIDQISYLMLEALYSECSNKQQTYGSKAWKTEPMYITEERRQQNSKWISHQLSSIYCHNVKLYQQV